jgi:hypothetical protein
MKTQFLSIFVTMIILSSCASSDDYLSKNFASVRANHKKIAILPFKVKFDRNENNKPRSAKFYEDQAFEASKDSQKELFSQLARQIKKGRFEIVVQDFLTTNKILDANNIRVENLSESAMGNLAQTLGVDALLVGDMNVHITKIDPYSIMPPNRYRDGVVADLKLYDALSGELLWHSSLSQRPSSPNDTPHRISSSLLSQLAKSLPYRN